jgi:hypothetical protein
MCFEQPLLPICSLVSSNAAATFVPISVFMHLRDELFIFPPTSVQPCFVEQIISKYVYKMSSGKNFSRHLISLLYSIKLLHGVLPKAHMVETKCWTSISLPSLFHYQDGI